MYRLYPYNLWSVLPFIILSYPYFQPIFFFIFADKRETISTGTIFLVKEDPC